MSNFSRWSYDKTNKARQNIQNANLNLNQQLTVRSARVSVCV